VHEGDDDPASGRTDRLQSRQPAPTTHFNPNRERSTYVAKSDGTASDVDFFPGQVEHLLGCAGDDGKGLVELPEGNVVLAHAGGLKGEGDGEGGGSGKVDGGASGVGVTWVCQRPQTDT
jgi:hypothetical protein